MQASGLMFGWRDITFYCKFIGLASMLVRLCLVNINTCLIKIIRILDYLPLKMLQRLSDFLVWLHGLPCPYFASLYEL